MPTFTFMGLEKTDIAEDRRHFDIQLLTDQGLVTLSVAAERLDGLITRLQGIEYRASLLDPAKGQQPGEADRFASKSLTIIGLEVPRLKASLALFLV